MENINKKTRTFNKNENIDKKIIELFNETYPHLKKNRMVLKNYINELNKQPIFKVIKKRFK